MQPAKQHITPTVHVAPAQTLPMALELERTLLGCAMLHPVVWPELEGQLTKQLFAEPAHQLIWLAIETLQAQGQRADKAAVSQLLQTQGTLKQAKGEGYLMDLCEFACGPANLGQHIVTLREKALQRNLIYFLAEQRKKLIEEKTDPFAAIAQIEEYLVKLDKRWRELKAPSLQDALLTTLTQVEERVNRYREGYKLPGISTGMPCVDDLIGGLRKGLIIPAAYANMGKTTFISQWASHIAKEHWVLYVSLEITREDMIKQMVAMDAHIPLQSLTWGSVDGQQFDQFQAGVNRLEHLKLNLIYNPEQLVEQIPNYIHAMRQEGKPPVAVFVDYLGLLQCERKDLDTRKRVSYCSWYLRNKVADKYSLPVVALSQLNRELTKRNNFKPRLSDLAESGDVERNAHQVLLISRPDRFGLTQDENGNDLRDLTFVDYAKVHFGDRPGEAVLRWNPTTNRLECHTLGAHMAPPAAHTPSPASPVPNVDKHHTPAHHLTPDPDDEVPF